MKLLILFFHLIYLLFVGHNVAAHKAVSSEPTYLQAARPNGHQCEVVNWMEMQQAIKHTNKVISWASTTPVVKGIQKKFKEQKFKFKDAMPERAKILGTVFQVKSSVINIHLPDIQSIQLTPTSVLSNTKLNFGIQSPAKLALVVNFDIEYSKKRTRIPGTGWSFCAWEWEFWKDCPATSLEIKASVDITNLHASADVELQVYKCSGGFFDQLACSFTSTWNFFVALFNGGFGDELLKRVGSAKVDKMKVAFDSTNIMAKAKVTKVYGEQDPKEFLVHAEVNIKEWLTKGKARGLFFKAINSFSKTAINKGLASFTEKFHGSCYRRH